ncbi:hypothetical protein AB0876_03775 [Mycobacterium sp. NPDC049093]
MSILTAVGRAIGDGLTLAAEILCPRDHTAEDRLRSWEAAAVAVEDEICDEAEADEDYLFTTTWAEYNATKSDEFESVSPCRRSFPCGPPALCGCSQDYEARRSDSSAAVSAAADPSPTVPNAHSVVGGEGSGGASDILQSAPPERPGHDDSFLIECTSPTCNCHGDPNYAPRESDPGAVSTPAPGEAKQCQYADAGGCIDIYACTECPPIDRSVSEDDLAAHLYADYMARPVGEYSTVSDLTALFARSLLADFNITKK